MHLAMFTISRNNFSAMAMAIQLWMETISKQWLTTQMKSEIANFLRLTTTITMCVNALDVRAMAAEIPKCSVQLYAAT